MIAQVNNIDSKQLHNWINSAPRDYRVIDVREHREIISGLIKGAEVMPLATLPARMTELSQDETIVIVCRSGVRSAQACGFLQQYGYDKVYNLAGGMIAWRASNFPYETA